MRLFYQLSSEIVNLFKNELEQLSEKNEKKNVNIKNKY